MRKTEILPEIIEKRIFIIRGHKVLLSTHLAKLYQVEVRALVQAVKRNKERFPEDFLFQLTKSELTDLKSQIVISSWGGARRASPYAFTEQGVAMLSSVLRSRRAIQVNIAIMRTFVRIRQMLTAHKELALKFEQLERRIEKQDDHIRAVFEAIRQLMASPLDDGYKKTKIGFFVDQRK